MNVNERLKLLRQHKKFSTYQMADKLKISQSKYVKLETDKQKLYVEELIKIAIILDVPIEAFYYDDVFLKALQGEVKYKVIKGVDIND